jgi:hypothetical protein
MARSPKDGVADTAVVDVAPADGLRTVPMATTVAVVTTRTSLR